MKEKDLNKKESLMPIYLYMILKNKSSKGSANPDSVANLTAFPLFWVA